jgi:UDP:flavonoid glycosyltransferase YjiC (YdhE family)
MHITLIAPGSQGAVRPYVALGRGLHAVGHTVRVATHQNFAPLVTGCGLAKSALSPGAVPRRQDPKARMINRQDCGRVRVESISSAFRKSLPNGKKGK